MIMLVIRQAVEEIANLQNMIIVIINIMFTHDYNHHVHS